MLKTLFWVRIRENVVFFSANTQNFLRARFARANYIKNATKIGVLKVKILGEKNRVLLRFLGGACPLPPDSEGHIILCGGAWWWWWRI